MRKRDENETIKEFVAEPKAENNKKKRNEMGAISHRQRI